jgi:hypothetical protein
MNTELKNKLKTYASFTAGTTLLSSALNAQIVHTNVNHNVGLNETYNLDIDGDSASDFAFYNYYFKTSYNLSSGSFSSIRNEMYFRNPDNYSKAIGNVCVTAIPLENEIGPLTTSFLSGTYNFIYSFDWYFYNTYSSNIISFSSFNTCGGFGGSVKKYIGIQFDISGQIHFGWLRINVNSILDPNTKTYSSTFQIIDMAYESTPNTAISAGAMFLAPPPSINLNAIVNGGNIDFTYDASTGEEAINEYRLFIVKEGTTFGLTEAEANSNYVSITPDGSPNYLHTFITGTVDSDGNTVLRTSPTLDISDETLMANQNYNIYVLNMAKTPYATENSLSTPSNSFTISSLGIYEKSKNVNAFYSNGKLNINIDNTLVGADVTIYNTLGQNILDEKLNTLSNSFNLKQSEGIYIIKIQKEDVLVSKKILVK